MGRLRAGPAAAPPLGAVPRPAPGPQGSATLHLSARRRAVLAAALAVTAAGSAPARAQGLGEIAPDVLGATLDGTEVQVSRHRGQVVVLSFWAAWCAPCRLELPQLEALQRAAGDRMRVVAINIEGRPEFKRAARALSELQLTVTHDYNKAIQRAYGVTSIPHLVVVGRDGRVRKVLKGYSEKQLDAILAQVNAALQEP